MNVNEIITEKIVKRIETAINNGEKFHWVKPWRGGCNQPISYITKKAYTGINRLILDPGMYITFNALQDYRKTQPEDKEIYIKKGATKYPVFFYSSYEAKDKDGNIVLDEKGEPVKKSFMKYFGVFDIEDVEGIEYPFAPKNIGTKITSKNTKLLDKLIEAYARQEGITIDVVKNGCKCFYNPKRNLVRIPDKNSFVSNYAYYSAVLHEIVHSTSQGLNRKFGKNFGSDKYAFEELVAQLGASFILTEIGMICDEKDEMNDIEYLATWASKFKENTAIIVKAASAAERAMEYFFEKSGYHRNKAA